MGATVHQIDLRSVARLARRFDAVTLIAHKSRDAMRRHPWMMDIADDPQFGPNTMRHFDQTLQAVSSLPIPFSQRLELVTAVDEYTFGFCMQERNNYVADEDTIARLEQDRSCGPPGYTG